MHLCHINSTSLKDIQAILGMVDSAFERNVNITVGAYPRVAASTLVGTDGTGTPTESGGKENGTARRLCMAP